MIITILSQDQEIAIDADTFMVDEDEPIVLVGKSSKLYPVGKYRTRGRAREIVVKLFKLQKCSQGKVFFEMPLE